MSERDLAEAIFQRLVADESIDTALELWGQLDGFEPRGRMLHLIAALVGSCICDMFIEREREAARTGPWDET